MFDEVFFHSQSALIFYLYLLTSHSLLSFYSRHFTLIVFFKNGPNPAYFCLFPFFSHDKYYKWKSIDSMLGTGTWGGRMVCADESSELWRHPILLWLLLYFQNMTFRYIFCSVQFNPTLNPWHRLLSYSSKNVKVSITSRHHLSS